MKVKASELIGPALNWAVAKCEGHDYWRIDIIPTRWTTDVFMPSTNWAQGGPIIEANRMAISYHPNPFSPGWEPWAASCFVHTYRSQSPLIAAMRCYVASKLGDEVEVPDNLI